MDKGKIALDGSPRDVYNDEARLIGIGLPKVTLLFQLLRRDGVQLPNPITIEEASTEIRRLLGR
jgi:energy-coupling factor transport system ATP-binding protein